MPSTGTLDKETVASATGTHLEPFRDIIDRFGLLLGRQAEARAALQPADLSGMVVEEERFLNGEPLVSFLDPVLFETPFRQAASQVWPVLGVIFPLLAESLAALGKKLEKDGPWTAQCLTAVAHGDGDALEAASARAGVAPDFLLMALRAAYAPCVAVHKEAMTVLVPIELWRKAHCPVCGSDPDLAVLESTSEPSEFLVSKGGEIWHHCPVCTSRWRFMRLACPGCNNQDHETLNRFSVPGAPREYIYACDACGQYLPCLDLLERADRVDFDLAALHAIHLDAAAQASGYRPLSPAPWTALGFAEAMAS